MTYRSPRFAPDRGCNPRLSSISTLLLCSAAFICPAQAQPAPITPAPSAIVSSQPTTQVLVAPRPSDPLANALFEWKSLQTGDNFSFATYATFLIAHRGWPDEIRYRKNAERMIRTDSELPQQVIAFFKQYPPLTPGGSMRYADALMANGQQAEALAVARRGWIAGAMAPEDETRFLTRYIAGLQPGDHDIRMDELLWTRATSNAARQILLVSQAKLAAFDARLAFLTKAPTATEKDALVSGLARSDAGFVADRVFWLRSTGQLDAARTMLAQPLVLSALPRDPDKWLNMVESVSDSAAKAGQFASAFDIARQVDNTYPAGTIIKDRSFAERDSYTNIVWLAGQAALTKLGRPADAIRMFELYGRAGKSPQTRVKGIYWAARAAEMAGKRDIANNYYSQAADFFDQFHGQLSAERLGKRVAPPNTVGTIEVSGSERLAFERSELVRAIILLGAMNNHQDQTRFVRTLASYIQSPVEHVLAADLATTANRPDLSVLVGKSARDKGYPDYFRASFPQLQVPNEHIGNWTMIHAITRQESQFDREIVSRAGAQGLMQLMPGTARQTAPSAGLTYNFSALTSDPQYNISMGSTYFGQMMDVFGGSHILAVAAYNAGPGNVRKWLKANGDPRAGVDPITWIEAIPIKETRDYVQRVLENAVVYDLINPRRPANRNIMLSSYLKTGQASFGSP